MFAIQHAREWQIFISRVSRKQYWLKHDGRDIRPPPIAQHRLTGRPRRVGQRIGSTHAIEEEIAGTSGICPRKDFIHAAREKVGGRRTAAQLLQDIGAVIDESLQPLDARFICSQGPVTIVTVS